MIGATAPLLALALAAGCIGGDDSGAPARRTRVAEGQTVEIARLAEGVVGLCQAGQEAHADPRVAKATYDARARAAVDSTARALQPAYAFQASTLTEAAERVDADFTADGPRSSLVDNLGRLAAAMRESLARLGIVTRACEK